MEREWLFGNVKKHYLKKKLWAINLMSDALEQPSVYESLISHNSQKQHSSIQMTLKLTDIDGKSWIYAFNGGL